MKAGPHRIVVGLPEDTIAVKKEITLVEGAVNNLVVEPKYGSKPGMRRPRAYSTTSFMEGIRSIHLTLNGREI